MKKFFSIILLAFYTVSAVGVNINLHYCGDDLEAVSNECEDHCCDETADNDECCTNDSYYLHLSKEVIPTFQNQNIDFLSLFLHGEKIELVIDQRQKLHNPLLPEILNIRKIPIFKQNCSFKIFDIS